MKEVQSPLNIVSESKLDTSSADKDALISRLDELLEQYLNTLDKYQRAREQLSKQLSSGYLSIAQANFQNRSTLHYGQDSYDERMQATRKIIISGSDESSITLSTVSESQEMRPEQDEKSKEEQPHVPEASKTESHSTPASNEKDTFNKTSKKSTDPLRWFGILVPPALRSAQQSFISVVEGPIPQLATIARDLRNQEIEIGRMRKQIKKL